MIKCPKCGDICSCPCESCQAENPTEKPWLEFADLITCSGCGFTEHSSWWEDEAMRQYEEEVDNNPPRDLDS